ncbi:MAG TPA: apolipoprotein N-acyltransferase [Epsilonproteobacteria bacterium]|nr:apolipoprotein N-acyltransferase [Campylobacterota bacterium]
MNKIRQYFSTLEITRGLGIALLGSSFIYLNHWGFSYPFLNTILALCSLFFLLQANQKVWFWYGVFIGIFWFWWIALALKHYGYTWGFPVGLFLIAFGYGIIFWILAWTAEKASQYFVGSVESRSTVTLLSLTLKALGLLGLSYLHPFGFDWLKPELIFIESYFGIEKWQFGLILVAISLSIWRGNLLLLAIVLFAYQPTMHKHTTDIYHKIALVSTHTSVEQKWDKSLHPQQFKAIFAMIDQAIAQQKSLIILPESVFPVFLNHSQNLIDELQKRAQYINIIVGALYADGQTPRNSTYIFTKGTITVANKVILVPFGESNPLPDFLSKWINKVFYDGAIDYQASSDVIDYTVDGVSYRNAICFEATSEKLYSKDKNGNYPKNMIVLSNDGWFTPSIEPTLQKLLLQYYSKKYGTTIYHSVNMSESYIIDHAHVLKE